MKGVFRNKGTQISNRMDRDVLVTFREEDVLGETMWTAVSIETGKSYFYPYKKYEIDIHFERVG